MSALATCGECDGFVPSANAACPHCGHVDAGRPARAAKTIGKVAVVAATMMTLMACYGGGPRRMMEPEVPICSPQDKDMDGAYTCENSNELPQGGMPIDCNDGDANTLPGAVDPIGDGVDQDCDGSDGTPSTRAPGGAPVPAGAALQPMPAPAPAGGFASPP